MDAGPDARPGEEKARRREGELHTLDPGDHPSTYSPVLIVDVSQCKQVTSEEVMDLKSLARGLPSCVLKKVKAMRTLMEKRELRNITKRMRRGQLKAVLQGVSDKRGLNVGINDKHHFRLQTKAGKVYF